jgi:serine/threonine protein phosphatase PrpC
VSIQSIGLGDGVYDKLSNDEIARRIYESTSTYSGEVHQTLGRSIDAVIIEVFNRQVTDNVSIVMVAFDAFCKKMGAVAKVYKVLIQA